jgi:arylsulfatase
MEVHGYGAPEEYVDDDIDYEKAKGVVEDMSLLPDLSEEEKELLVGLYDGQIRYVDEKIEELVDMIREEYPDTVFIFTSDHGQNSGHYGVRNHQYGIWERLIRVPLIVWGEDVPSKEIAENVSLRKLHDLILGEEGFEEITSEKVFAEYYGVKNFAVKFGNKDIDKYPSDKMHYVENTSKAVVENDTGFVRNSHIDDFVFEAA